MVQFDAATQPIYFARFYRAEPTGATRIPIFDLAEAKASLQGELLDRIENHRGPGKPPLIADIIDEDEDQLLVVRYVAPDRVDAYELNAEKTAVRRVKD